MGLQTSAGKAVPWAMMGGAKLTGVLGVILARFGSKHRKYR